MLQRISELTTVYNEIFRERYYYYEMVDSEFGSVRHRLTDPDHAFVRIIIIEYSQRHLNVAYNLKLLFSNLAINHTYGELINLLNDYLYNLNGYNVSFQDYYNCLRRHVDRLKFVGKLK
jgi:hypothetical protein